uniref:Replication factor A C-terminal domain-containing protein n=1 Tax=Brassica campestris TaxID=3711 RepID=M4EMR5_BRACM
MNSNSQAPISGDVTTTKPNGKDVVSSAEPVKRVGQTGVFLARSASGVSKSKKPVGRAVISSTDTANRAGHRGDPLATAISGDSKSKKSSGKAVASSAEPVKGTRQHGVSPAIAVSGDPKSKILNGRSVVSSSAEVLFFRDVKYGPQEGELRFRLIHFWEARNALTKVLFGLEMILIDGQVYSNVYDFVLVLLFRSNNNIRRFVFCYQQGTVIQGFIPPNRIETYLPHMFAGSVYRLNNFYGSKSKTVYRVAEPLVTIAFSWNSVLSPLENSPIPFPEDRFRFYGYEEFEAACDLKGDLYDYVGHMKLVNEQTLSDSLVLDEVKIASSRRILVHVQTHDGPVMKLYIWDKVAVDFCEKFKALGKPPTVILVTTVNPKRFGGALTLSSLSSSRVFFDMDVQATREYLAWFESNTEVANRVYAEIVTKAETATIGELLSYMMQEEAKVAWFECTATIDDVVRDSAWYYIACGGCKTKATKGPTTLMCKKCGKTEIVGTPEYLTKISVYDNNDHASFVLLGDARRELTGMKASDLVESYFEANENVGDDHVVPVPQSLTDSIGQSRTFIIKVSKHNLDGKTQTLTVTKVLPLEVPALEGDIDEGVEEEPVDEKDGAADGNVKRISDGIESGETKRAKCD